MTKTLSVLRDDTDFAACVTAAEAGEDVIILRDGKPTARLIALAPPSSDRRQHALARLKEIQAEGLDLNLGPFNRDALHER